MLAGKDLQLEPQILWQAHELGALLFKPEQGVDAHDISRNQVVELHERWLGPASTSFEKIRHLCLCEAASQVHDPPIPFVSNLNPARHAGRNARDDPTIFNGKYRKISLPATIGCE